MKMACLPCLVLAVSTGALAQTPGVYRIDPRASRIEIHVFRAGLFGGLGDNHVILLRRFSGTAKGEGGANWTIAVTAEAGSLEVVDPGTAPERREEVQEKMLGPSQMDTARYPTIEVRSRSVQPGDTPGTWRIISNVTVHGVARQAEFPLAWTETGTQLRVQGKQTLRLRDFGIEPVRLGLGAVKVKNEFELVYELVLKKE